MLTGCQLDPKSLHISIGELLLELVLLCLVLHPDGADFIVLHFLLGLLFLPCLVVDGVLLERVWQLDHLSAFVVTLCHHHPVLVICLGQCICEALDSQT